MNTGAQMLLTLGESFEKRYGAAPLVCRAPGRVNLIGEHTDYNDGFVMPAAIQYYTYAAASPRADRRIVVASENLDESVEFGLDDAKRGPTGHWSDYVRGVAAKLDEAGGIGGANLLIRGEVPLGAGLSSSAAIEVATAFALLAVSKREMDRVEIALLCQAAEHQYAGTKCGIMDQFIACFGQANRALLLDCRSLEQELLPLPGGVSIVICNSKVKHELASGEYNARRLECAEGAKRIGEQIEGVKSLRDVSPELLEQFRNELTPVVYRRCRHVVTEIARTKEAAAALKSLDVKRFGVLMGESHRSLRDDYEVSCKELDILVDLALSVSGVYGSRMTGGGFGGCTVNLVRDEAVNEFKGAMMNGYERLTGIKPDVFVTPAAEGAGPISMDVVRMER